MAVILSEAKVVFENHELAQSAAVSEQISQRKAAGMTVMHLSLYFHISVISCSGASVVSPETAAAAQTLLQCHDNPISTGHARRLSEAVANLEPYVDRKPYQYNQSSKVQRFEVGEHVGLHTPTELREKMDPRFVLCMVIHEQRLDGYKLRCEHGLVQGVVGTDQLVSWKSEHSFPFTASDDVRLMYNAQPDVMQAASAITRVSIDHGSTVALCCVVNVTILYSRVPMSVCCCLAVLMLTSLSRKIFL